jgi:hypothetical protein
MNPTKEGLADPICIVDMSFEVSCQNRLKHGVDRKRVRQE